VAEDERATGVLPPEAVVVRGGIMLLENLRDNVLNHYDKVLVEEGREEWALSVNCVPGLDVEATAKQAARLNRQMCVSTVGAIESLGYELRPDWTDDGHVNILFDTEPTDDDLLALRGVFSGPIPNPGQPI